MFGSCAPYDMNLTIQCHNIVGRLSVYLNKRLNNILKNISYWGKKVQYCVFVHNSSAKEIGLVIGNFIVMASFWLRSVENKIK